MFSSLTELSRTSRLPDVPVVSTTLPFLFFNWVMVGAGGGGVEGGGIATPPSVSRQASPSERIEITLL